MIACVDIHYRSANVTAACLGFESWTDETSSYEAVVESDTAAAAYRPGEFYRRELPYLLSVLCPLNGRLEVAIVDGYVWLGAGRRGLGAHVHEVLGCRVIGVAKSPFASADSVPVVRSGARPLYVTSVGIEPELAATHIRSMAGPFRMPTLLKRVDQLARRLVRPTTANVLT